MTTLKRKLTRETNATIFEIGRHREVMVSLEPPYLIGLRLKGTRRTFYLSADKAYLAAVKAHVAAEARDKSQRQAVKAHVAAEARDKSQRQRQSKR